MVGFLGKRQALSRVSVGGLSCAVVVFGQMTKVLVTMPAECLPFRVAVFYDHHNAALALYYTH